MTPFITALTRPSGYAHPVDRIALIETHISWILLAGEFAYKIKKPVVLPFVDFSSLAARHEFCLDELRLNRRLAPQLYLDVVPITGTRRSPRVEGSGRALEYAVKMRRFDQAALFDRLIARNALTPERIDQLAARIAAFHVAAPSAADSEWGTPEHVLQPALANFIEMAPHATGECRARLELLQAWTLAAFKRLEPVFAERRRQGHVRECHGDLHLGNIALIDDQPVPFDCIEFSAALRWIDVMSEAAFLVMDLIDHGRGDLGYRFLDGYLAGTGDYAGVAVLRFYLVYRALVRAKIHDLRARQVDDDTHEMERLRRAADRYLALAERLAHEARPALILMHGFSGSGKSRVAAELATVLGAIRIRSDVERKRLFGLGGADRSGSPLGAGIYGPDAGKRTYARLAELAQTILAAGYPVILDAAFLARGQRDTMYRLADKTGATLRIVDCSAPESTLRERVSARAAAGGDPSEATVAVLDRQIAAHDALRPDEQRRVVRCAMDGSESVNVAECLKRVLGQLEMRAVPSARPGDPAPARPSGSDS